MGLARLDSISCPNGKAHSRAAEHFACRLIEKGHVARVITGQDLREDRASHVWYLVRNVLTDVFARLERTLADAHGAERALIVWNDEVAHVVLAEAERKSASQKCT